MDVEGVTRIRILFDRGFSVLAIMPATTLVVVRCRCDIEFDDPSLVSMTYGTKLISHEKTMHILGRGQKHCSRPQEMDKYKYPLVIIRGSLKKKASGP